MGLVQKNNRYRKIQRIGKLGEIISEESTQQIFETSLKTTSVENVSSTDLENNSLDVREQSEDKSFQTIINKVRNIFHRK